MPLDVTLLLDSGRIPSRPRSPCLPGPMGNTESRSLYSRVIVPQHALPAIPSLRVLRYLPTCQVRPVLQALMVSLAVYSLRSAFPLTRAAALTTDPEILQEHLPLSYFLSQHQWPQSVVLDLERYKVASLSPSIAFSIQIISFIFSTSSSHLLILHPSSLLPPPSSPPSSFHSPPPCNHLLNSLLNFKSQVSPFRISAHLQSVCVSFVISFFGFIFLSFQ